MGTIRLIHGTLERTLPHHFLVGRSDACDLRLGNPYVSSQHAVVHWNGKVWMVRDLASRNGTYLDGQRLDPGLDHRLQVEDRLSFGDRDEPWTISDDDEPVLMAVHASSSQARVGRESILALPDEAGLEVSIYLDQDGRWKMEGAEERGPHPVVDRQRVVTSKGAWIIHLPGLSEHTPVARSQLSFDTVGFRFAVRKQDERVRMTLLTPYVEQELAEREHSRLLLALALARRADAALPHHRRGWRDRDELEELLDTDANALNVAVHRARQQVAAAGVRGAARLVEVRRRQRRLGTDRFQIVDWT